MELIIDILTRLNLLTDGTQLIEVLIEMSLHQTGKSFIPIWRIYKILNFIKLEDMCLLLDKYWNSSLYFYKCESNQYYEDAKNNLEKASDLDQNHFNSYFHLAKKVKLSP